MRRWHSMTVVKGRDSYGKTRLRLSRWWTALLTKEPESRTSRPEETPC